MRRLANLGLGALRMTADIHARALSDADADELRARMGAMPAHADAEPGLERLRKAGFTMVTLTNSPPGPAPTPLDKAGIGHFFQRNFSVEAVQRFKPAPQTYRHVAEELGTTMQNLCLVACHLWDTIGAQAAGGLGALVTRPHNAVLPARNVPQPDLVAPDLDALSRMLVQRWTQRG